MKATRLFQFIGLITILGLTGACAPSVEVRQKECEAQRNIGEAYMLQGNYTQALKELLEAEKIYADDYILQNYLGLAYLNKNKFDLAIAHFKKAIQLKPGYAPALNNLGTAYLMAKDWDRAIEIFEAVTKDLLYATPHYPLANLGYAYYNKKDYQKAEAYYRKALEIEPRYINALLGLGRTYIAALNLKEALTVLESAAKFYPQSAEVYFELATAYKLSGRYREAVWAYGRAGELSPPDSALAAQAREEMALLPK
jgi:tetratricopeptide (TPR) repeat protein